MLKIKIGTVIPKLQKSNIATINLILIITFQTLGCQEGTLAFLRSGKIATPILKTFQKGFDISNFGMRLILIYKNGEVGHEKQKSTTFWHHTLHFTWSQL